MKKRLIAIMMTLAMMTCLMPTFAFAGEEVSDEEPMQTEEITEETAELSATEENATAELRIEGPTAETSKYAVYVYGTDCNRLGSLPAGVSCEDNKIILDGAEISKIDIEAYDDIEIIVQSDSSLIDSDQTALQIENYDENQNIHSCKIKGNGKLVIDGIGGIFTDKEILTFEGVNAEITGLYGGINIDSGEIVFDNSNVSVNNKDEGRAINVFSQKENAIILKDNCEEKHGYKVFTAVANLCDAGEEETLYDTYFVNPDDDSAVSEVEIVTKEAPAPPAPVKAQLASSADSFRATASGKNAIQLAWPAVGDADRFVVYGAASGKKNKLQKFAEITDATNILVTNINGAGLKKNTAYKFCIEAYKGGQLLSASNEIHVYTTGFKGKYGNVTKITSKTKSIKVKAGKKAKKAIKIKTKRVKGKKMMPKSHGPQLRYVSSNPAVATVTKKGKVKGISAGTATIYTYSINGLFCTTPVTVA